MQPVSTSNVTPQGKLVAVNNKFGNNFLIFSVKHFMQI